MNNIETILAEKGAKRHCPQCDSLRIYRIFWDFPAKGSCYECDVCGCYFDGEGTCGCGNPIEEHCTGEGSPNPPFCCRPCNQYLYKPYQQPKPLEVEP